MFQIVLQHFSSELEKTLYSRAQLYCFFMASNWTHILLTSRLAWFLKCFYILSFNYQGLSNLLDYCLFARMNLKRRSFTTTKYNLLWSKWDIFLDFHRAGMLKNNTNYHLKSSQKFILAFHSHFAEKNYGKERFFGNCQASVNYRDYHVGSAAAKYINSGALRNTQKLS